VRPTGCTGHRSLSYDDSFYDSLARVINEEPVQSREGMESSPDPRFSTWGGGSGLTVIYGAAAPVKPPRIGVVQRY
jgi:hypothetical protein